MGLNSSSINSVPVNGYGAATSFIGEIAPISIEQNVAIIGSGSLISIEQDVQLRLSSSIPESLISIEQKVRILSSGSLISIQQNVVDSSIFDYLSRCGFDLILVIDGYQIPKEQIHGMVNVSREESAASLLNLTLMTPAGVQDVESYHGKTITLDATTDAGTFRIYTGIIDIPSIDLIEEKITLHCTDRRTEQLNNQLPGVVETIGVYSDRIFTEPEDTAQEVEQRLSTTPHAVDFDAYGNYTITSWFPKTVQDFTLLDADVYRNKPTVDLASRGRIINKVDISLNYRYERFYHITRNFSWVSPIATDICKMLSEGYTIGNRAAILQATNSAGWPVKGEIRYTDIWPSGWYSCGTNTIGWFTKQTQGSMVPKLDAQGNEVKDSEGNVVLEVGWPPASETDYSKIYCNGASWKATTQWAQTITEEHTLSVAASQSVAQFGEIAQDLSYAIDTEANDRAWEDYESYSSSLSSENYYIDQDTTRSEFNNAADVALRIAKNTILGSHRDTRVTINKFLWPQIDLKHTVYVNTDEIKAKGKVTKIDHKINISTGEAVTTTEISLFRAAGSGSDDALTIPSKPSDNISFNTQNITLGNHYGEDPTTEAAAKWNGQVGNKWVQGPEFKYITKYQEQFIVDTPFIPDTQRLAKELISSDSYNVEIPNDTLTITFDGKA